MHCYAGEHGLMPIFSLPPAIISEALPPRIPRVVIQLSESSASYKAHRQGDNSFSIMRMEHNNHAPIMLGRVIDEDRAQRLLDWWVTNDRRVQLFLALRDLNQPTPFELVDLMIEAAQVC